MTADFCDHLIPRSVCTKCTPLHQSPAIHEDDEVRGFPNRGECPQCPHGRLVHSIGGCWQCGCEISWKEIA